MVFFFLVLQKQCVPLQKTEKPREQKLPSPMLKTHRPYRRLPFPTHPFSHHRAWNPHCVSAGSLRQNSQAEFRGQGLRPNLSQYPVRPWAGPACLGVGLGLISKGPNSQGLWACLEGLKVQGIAPRVSFSCRTSWMCPVTNASGIIWIPGKASSGKPLFRLSIEQNGSLPEDRPRSHSKDWGVPSPDQGQLPGCLTCAEGGRG